MKGEEKHKEEGGMEDRNIKVRENGFESARK